MLHTDAYRPPHESQVHLRAGLCISQAVRTCCGSFTLIASHHGGHNHTSASTTWCVEPETATTNQQSLDSAIMRPRVKRRANADLCCLAQSQALTQPQTLEWGPAESGQHFAAVHARRPAGIKKALYDKCVNCHRLHAHHVSTMSTFSVRGSAGI